MNRSILIFPMLAALGLAACDKPTVVNVPPSTTSSPAVVPVPVPVPVPGPAGPTGMPGNDGSPGAPGKPGDSSTVIVVPPSPAPAN